MKITRFVFLSNHSGNKKMTRVESNFHDHNQRLSEKDIVEYVLQRFQCVKQSKRMKNLVIFHTANKYMIMVHHQEELKILGNIVANHIKRSFAEILEDYEKHLIITMSKIPTVKTHSNAIMHIFGYFLKYLNQSEKQLFLDILEEFREGKITIGEILLKIGPMAYRFDSMYLPSQTYFLLYSDIDQNTIFKPVKIKEYE